MTMGYAAARARGWRLGLAGLCLGAAAVAGCGKGAAAKEEKAADPKPVTVTVAAAEKRADLQRAIHVVGSLAPFERSLISNRVAGNVVKIYVTKGDRVTPGQKLAEIETDRTVLVIRQANESLQENLLRLGLDKLPTDEKFDIEKTTPVQKALTELAAAKVKFDRAEGLYKQNLMKEFEYFDIQAAMRVAETNVQSAKDDSRARLVAARGAKTLMDLKQKDLTDSTVVAPDGKTPEGEVDSYSVDERKVSVWEYEKEGSPMFSLVADRVLKLQARVPERYLREVVKGQRVKFKVEAYKEREFSGVVTTLDPSVDEKSRTFMVEARVENKEGLLKPGSFVQAEVLTATEAVVMVPVEAVTSFAGVTKVFVLDASGTKVRQVAVEPGQQEGSWVEIPQGISAGDKVVRTGQTKLVEGSAVVVRDVGGAGGVTGVGTQAAVP